MVRFKLVPYVVRVKNKNSNEYIRLDRIPTIKGDIDFINIFNDLLKSYKRSVYIPKEKKTFFVEDFNFFKHQRLVYGILKSGEYGYEADFYDVKQNIHIRGARKEEHSEEIPFFFMFHSPLIKNSDKGFLILQKFKNLGIKSILTKAIQNYIQELDNSLAIEIHPLINNKLIERVESLGRVVELKLIKREIPKDVADKILIENYEDVYEERSFKIKKKKDIKFKDNIKDFIKKLKNIEYPYLEIEDEKYDEVKIIIEKGKSKKTVRIEDLPRFRESLPLDENQLILERGFPTYDSLLKHAIEYINIILESLDENMMGG